MMDSLVRVLIVDQEDLFRRGLAITFDKHPDVEVAGQARNGEEAVRLAARLRPTVALVALNLPDMNGLQVARMILRQRPETRVAIIARMFTRPDLVAAATSGVHGYLTKDITVSTLVDAVKRVSRGETYISAAASQLLIEEVAAANAGGRVAATNMVHAGGHAKVTDREREVLHLIVQGATNRDIASRLLITENTVKVHLRNILDKLHLRNRQQAAAYAVSSGLVELQHGGAERGDGGQKSTATTWRQRSG